MDQNIIEKAAEIISAKRLDCVLALIDLDGYPTASAITVSKNDKINWITFVTVANNDKTKRIAQCNRASVCFLTTEPQAPLYNITLVGKIEAVTDPEIKKEMWYDLCKDHFSGPEDVNYCVLKFVTERYRILVDWQFDEGKI
jgi:general stress protein 26